MAEYTEYERKLSGDPMSDYKIVWSNMGKIRINENLIESEKEIFANDETTSYRFKLVRMASGAEHFLLVDKHTYTSTLKDTGSPSTE